MIFQSNMLPAAPCTAQRSAAEQVMVSSNRCWLQRSRQVVHSSNRPVKGECGQQQFPWRTVDADKDSAMPPWGGWTLKALKSIPWIKGMPKPKQRSNALNMSLTKRTLAAIVSGLCKCVETLKGLHQVFCTPLGTKMGWTKLEPSSIATSSSQLKLLDTSALMRSVWSQSTTCCSTAKGKVAHQELPRQSLCHANGNPSIQSPPSTGVRCKEDGLQTSPSSTSSGSPWGFACCSA